MKALIPITHKNLATATNYLALGNRALAAIANKRAKEIQAIRDDAWLDELIAWADENEIKDYYFDELYDCWIGFPRDKKAILNLTELHLKDNQLSKLPESIGNLTNLTTLNLGSNQLSKLPESIGNLTHLTTLDLSGNPSTDLWFGPIDNRLTELPESIGNLTHLTRLDLRDNQLSKLPESIGNLAHLTTLVLGWGQDQLSELPELSHVNIVTVSGHVRYD